MIEIEIEMIADDYNTVVVKMNSTEADRQFRKRKKKTFCGILLRFSEKFQLQFREKIVAGFATFPQIFDEFSQ